MAEPIETIELRVAPEHHRRVEQLIDDGLRAEGKRYYCWQRDDSDPTILRLLFYTREAFESLEWEAVAE